MGTSGLDAGIAIGAGLLAGRVAVVTGGAGGIGAATCRLLAEAGADVGVVDVDEPRTREVVDTLASAPGTVLPVVADVTDPSAVDQVLERVRGELGDVDVLINGVGHHLGSAGSFENSQEEEWQALYEINLLHVLRFTRAVLPGMRARRWGRIVNFSSVEGIRSAPALAVYTAFKRAVDGFTKSVAVDVARDGVLVNAIAVDKTRAYQVGHYELPDEYERLVETWIPAGRYGEPEDVARIVLFLASDLNTWIVGQTVVADGGTLSAGGWYRTPERWTNQPLLTQYFEDEHVNASRPAMLR